MIKLQVVDFINTHPDTWEKILSEYPFSIEIKWKDDYVLLKYNQIESDFDEPIVRECRGLILKKEPFHFVNQGLYGVTFRPVCVPFFKFFNAEEPNATDDLNKIIKNGSKSGLIATDKVDGSLIKVWYDNGWRISTNGNIDANDSNLQFQTESLKTYYDLFLQAKKNSGLLFDNLNPQYTYMFELISPYNRVVVRYTDTKLIHIGTRNNITLQEEEQDIGVEKPRILFTSNINNIINYAKELEIKDNTNYEGFVVRDYEYNRVKVKSPKYLELAYLKGDGIYSTRKIIDIVLKNESDEILAYFPEYKEDFDKVSQRLAIYIENIKDDLYWNMLPKFDDFLSRARDGRRDYASQVINMTNKGIMFKALDDYSRGITIDNGEWLWKQLTSLSLEFLEKELERIQL
jgi:hypothetical protein